MTICKPFSVIVVPFPFTDLSKSKKRPALVVSTEKFQKSNGYISLLMITTAKNSKWFGDLLISDLAETGLSVPSYVRQKIFTIDSRLIEKRIGHLSKNDIKKIKLLFHDCIEAS